MADLLGLDQQQQQSETTTDFLGVKVPISFKSQPALPTGIGGPTAASTSAAPPTIAGAGTSAPSGPTGPGFGDLAGAAIPGVGGGGAPGGGEGGVAPPDVGPGSATGVPSLSVPGTGGHVSVGLTGNVGVNTGNQMLDQALNFALGQGAKFAGATTSLPQILALVTHNPVVAAAAGAMSMMGLPLSVPAIGSFLASLNPNSIQSQLNQLQANPNVTAEDFAQFMAQIAQGFPVGGGPQAIGTAGRVAAGLDNPVANPAATTQAGGPPGAGQNLSLAESMTPTPTFAALANAFGFGREDTAGPSAPAPPDAPAPGDTTTGGPGEV